MAKISLEDYIENKQKLILDFLDINLPNLDEKSNLILKSIRYSLFPGGKKIRSLLSIMVSEMFGFKDKNILFLACALELIHTYSLIHDDLPAIDNDNFRRGKESSHRKYGEAIAILTGDASLTLAFELITKMHIKAEIIVKIIREISNAIGMEGMIGGQVVDIEFNHKSFDDINTKANVLSYIHSNKTARFIKSSMLVGAFAADVSSDKIISKISNCGEMIGFAFQIMDDILDQSGREDIMGKTLGKDKKYQKLTYPSVYGIKYSKNKVKELINKSIEILNSFDSSKLLRAFVEKMLYRNN